MRFDIPVDPDAATARKWLEDELTKPEYRERQAGWFQRALDWLQHLIDRLFSMGDGVGGISAPGTVIIGFLVLVLIVVLLYVFLGPVRRSRRSRKSGAVFDDDDREATDIRAAAIAAAEHEDWELAVIERFRALVRAAEERNLVLVVPGMTGHEFTSAVAARLEALEDSLERCAEFFDLVRYGHGAASKDMYDFIATTDDAVAAARAKAQV